MLDQIGKQVLENMQDAIAVATGDLGLLPGAAFQARVMQLAQLNAAHQTVSQINISISAFPFILRGIFYVYGRFSAQAFFYNFLE